jgi:hypothetical protein
MEISTDARYHFSDRLKGESRFELFNTHYLCGRTLRMKKQREFKMEVAILNPEAQKIEDLAWHWLVAGLLSLAAAIYLVYYLLTSPGSNNTLALLGGVGILILLSAGFTIAFWLGSERKWVFRTRAAQYPLVNIPFHKSNRKEASEFVERLQQAIITTTEKKGYSDDDLFAGEMRMLRRLAKAGVISDSIYDSAKKHMLGKNQQMTAAPGI